MLTKEHKQKISEGVKRAYKEGRKTVEPNFLAKAHCFSVGHTPWNKGVNEATNTGRTHFKKGQIAWNKGKKTGHIPWNKGIKFEAVRGENHWNWQGGKVKYNRFRVMTYEENRKYLDWRMAVFERDDYTCQDCGKRGGDLHADHVKQWASYPELRFELSNGQTLCVPCHRATPTYSRKVGLSADSSLVAA